MTGPAPERAPRADRRARQVRYRQRVAASRIVVAVEIDGEILNLLVASELLDEGATRDKQAIGNAIVGLLKHTRIENSVTRLHRNSRSRGMLSE